MVALGKLTFRHGTKVTLFNRKGPKVKPMTKADVKRLSSHAGEIRFGRWQAVVDGVAYVVTVEECE